MHSWVLTCVVRWLASVWVWISSAILSESLRGLMAECHWRGKDSKMSNRTCKTVRVISVFCQTLRFRAVVHSINQIDPIFNYNFAWGGVYCPIQIRVLFSSNAIICRICFSSCWRWENSKFLQEALQLPTPWSHLLSKGLILTCRSQTSIHPPPVSGLPISLSRSLPSCHVQSFESGPIAWAAVLKTIWVRSSMICLRRLSRSL